MVRIPAPLPPTPRRRLLLLAPLLACALPASAQPRDVPLVDVLQVLVREREVLAIDAESGGQLEEDLHLGERVLWHGSRGRVGVVLTDQRLLAAGVGSGAWQDARWRSAETRPTGAMLGERVALVLTSQRALAFDGGSRNLVESSLGPRETVLVSRVSENLGVVVTDRRALGVSPFVGGFFETKLQLGERIQDLAAAANVATLTTSRRLLIFRAPTGSWEERNLDLR
jgi:hypothetical protein